jgi:hypothetical protein
MESIEPQVTPRLLGEHTSWRTRVREMARSELGRSALEQNTDNDMPVD